MDFNDYTELVKGHIIKLDVHGEKSHFMIVPSGLSSDFMKLMNDDSIDESNRLLRVIAHALCDENGKRVFDPENEEHLKIIINIPTEIQICLIETMAEIMFPKKKQLKGQK